MRRTIATGFIRSGYKTIHLTYACLEGEPTWEPSYQPSDEPDYDLIRKQRAEAELVAGDRF